MAAAGILFGCVVPHPPVLLPEVGQEMAREVEPTVEALQRLGSKIASYEPETLVLISPHGPLYRDSMSIGLAPRADGDFANFQAPQVTLSVPCDVDLARAIQLRCDRVAIPLTPVDQLTKPGSDGSVYWLDHGAAVPLHFLLPLLGDVKVVVLGFSFLPRTTHSVFGQHIREACQESGRRVVFVASGDLSHRLTQDAPAGYDPLGQVFDEEVVAGLAAGDWDRIRQLPENLVERAGVCGYLSILTLAGAMEQVSSRVLSYQGPFGVGYVVAQMEPGSDAGEPLHTSTPAVAEPSNASSAADTIAQAEAAIRESILRRPETEPLVFEGEDLRRHILTLARAALETYVRTGSPLIVPEEVPAALQDRRSCFVTLREHGQLRGCVGTIQPSRENLAAEIVDNAIGSGSRDYRFRPVTAEELQDLAYSVDVLSPLQLATIDQMDPRNYGMVVQQGSRIGVLLPGIPEVRDAQQQFEVCCQKAGISSPEHLQIMRFTVDRFAEPGAEH